MSTDERNKDNKVPYWVVGVAAGINALILSSTRSMSQHTPLKSFNLITYICKYEGVRRLWCGAGWYFDASTISQSI